MRNTFLRKGISLIVTVLFGISNITYAAPANYSAVREMAASVNAAADLQAALQAPARVNLGLGAAGAIEDALIRGAAAKTNSAGKVTAPLVDPGNMIISGVVGPDAANYRATITPKRTPEEVRAFLKQAGGVTWEGHLRGLDFGSSQDLQGLKELLTALGATDVAQLPSTTIFASNFRVRLKIEALDDDAPARYDLDGLDNIVYVSRIHRITEDKPAIYTDRIQLNAEGEAPRGQIDAVAYMLWNLCGITGVKVTFDIYYPGAETPGIERMVEGAGMGTSGTTNTGLLMLGSMLSGADLSTSDIISQAIDLENKELGGFTGGQEGYSSTFGGAKRATWFGGKRDATGALTHHPFSALMTDVCSSEADFQFMEDSVVLVQPGVNYVEVGGKIVKDEHRSASSINTMWMAQAEAMVNAVTGELIPLDPVGAGYHRGKLEAGNLQAEGARTHDIGMVNRGNAIYVEARNNLCLRFARLVLEGDPEHNLPAMEEWLDRFTVSDRVGIATYVLESPALQEELQPLLDKVEAGDELSPDETAQLNTRVKQNLRRFLDEGIALYSHYAKELYEAAEADEDVSAIGLGAGGHGGVVAVFSKKGIAHLREFLAKLGINEFDPADVERTLTETGGEFKGWFKYEIGRKPFSIEFGNPEMTKEKASELGYIVPELPGELVYDETTGEAALKTNSAGKVTAPLVDPGNMIISGVVGPDAANYRATITPKRTP
ncbi:MAG: hypothetical protein HQ558_05850, partial [Candidatus Omnitrophica bacterium]|nr:hypothetical protein [Candidatus Omnitrophota bacterium]